MMDAHIGVMVAGALLLAGISLLGSRERGAPEPPRQRRQPQPEPPRQRRQPQPGRRRARVTPDKRKEIAMDLVGGRLYEDEIAVKHGVSVRTVRRAAAAILDGAPVQQGKTLPESPPPKSPAQTERRRRRRWRHALPLEQRVEVARALARNSNAAMVAFRHGISGAKARQIRRDGDVPFLTSLERVEAAISSARSGACAEAIAMLHGCSKATAKAVFRHARDEARKARVEASNPPG